MRILGLDLIRLAAVALVLGRHLGIPGDPGGPAGIWQRGGWVGVDLFFVLSGFLVSSLLFREIRSSGTADVKRFLVRRGFRIYPAFWVFLAVSIGVRAASGHAPATRPLLGELLFLQNYVGGLWNHTWSLAVEEHFYFGLAALVAVLLALGRGRGERSMRAVPAVFAVVAVGCLALRVLTLATATSFTNEAFLMPTHLRIDSLAFGTLLSYLYHFRDLERRVSAVPTWALYLTGGALLAPAFVFSVETHVWVPVVGVVLFWLGGGAVVLAAIRMPTSSSRTLRTCGALGAASYSIYLWHMPVRTWGVAIFGTWTGVQDPTVLTLFYVASALLVGWTVHRLIETPSLRLRERLFPTRGAATATAADRGGPPPRMTPRTTRSMGEAAPAVARIPVAAARGDPGDPRP